MQLVTYPDPVLRTECAPVPRVGKKEKRLFRQMLARMREWGGIGLAAPQVGLSVRVIVVEDEGIALTVANPVVVACEGLERQEERCLSLPGRAVSVIRPVTVRISALDENSIHVELKHEGIVARALQHEIDHLNGVLIIDHQPAVDREPAGAAAR